MLPQWIQDTTTYQHQTVSCPDASKSNNSGSM